MATDTLKNRFLTFRVKLSNGENSTWGQVQAENQRQALIKAGQAAFDRFGEQGRVFYLFQDLRSKPNPDFAEQLVIKAFMSQVAITYQGLSPQATKQMKERLHQVLREIGLYDKALVISEIESKTLDILLNWQDAKAKSLVVLDPSINPNLKEESWQ